jgi:hypothetical protein
MGRYAPFAAAALLLGLTSCDYYAAPWVVEQPALLACHGNFGQFANGFMVARPMELNFAADWLIPSIATSGGTPGHIISLTPYEVTFEIQYAGYKALYHINRIEGTIQQLPNVGGVFSGRCDQLPLRQKF